MIDLSDHVKIEKVINYFLQMSRIPRGSGNTKEIADFLYSFGVDRGLESYRDEYDNVVIKKPAAKGYESRPTLVIQGHLDMVCEKESDCTKDMAREGLDVYRDGDFIRAKGTTLGADDGIAIAYCLAILDSEAYEHPALECVFTSDEETGLTGAMNIKAELITGRRMLNIDSEGEGVFTVGCAGGVKAKIHLGIERERYDGLFYEILIDGLMGGHSGVEIDKNRANALKILANLISSVEGARICELRGGNADNAIPRDAYAKICVDSPLNKEALTKLLKELAGEETPTISVKECDGCSTLTKESTKTVLSLISSVPTGVYKMSEDIKGLVETSLNVAVAKTGTDDFALIVSIRSSVESEKAALLGKVREIAESLGATLTAKGDYPGWAYKKESPLRDALLKSFKSLYGYDASVIMIHAGLECGIFSDKLPGLDCVSFGPELFDIHTPKERLSLSSTERTWDLILTAMKNI